MRTLLLLASLALCASASSSESASTDAFEQLKALVGEWRADLPGSGSLTNSIRLVSGGIAIEETIGTQAHNETSVYVRDGKRILLTHFCALTPDGHQARLETAPIDGAPQSLTFIFRDAANLHSPAARHMRRVFMKIVDHDHFTEKWTQTENGKDTVFDLSFVRL
jgi:hypothetical protein